MQKIQTKAKAHGTFNSPSTGSIIYVDPDHDNESYHSPRLTDAEAKVAFERGLIEDPEKAKAADDEPGETVNDPNAIGNVAAARTAELTADNPVAEGAATSLESRQSTAFPDMSRVAGGADGYVDGIRDKPEDTTTDQPSEIDQESGDEDAAPAPTARTTKPRGGKAQ